MHTTRKIAARVSGPTTGCGRTISLISLGVSMGLISSCVGFRLSIAFSRAPTCGGLFNPPLKKILSCPCQGKIEVRFNGAFGYGPWASALGQDAEARVIAGYVLRHCFHAGFE